MNNLRTSCVTYFLAVHVVRMAIWRFEKRHPRRSKDRRRGRIGLLAGIGRLPVEFARAACGMGFAVTAIALTPSVDAELKTVVTDYHEISIGQLDRIIAVLTAADVEEATLLGKVTKELMFSGQVTVDDRMKRMLAGLKDFSDDTLMLAFVKELASVNIGVLDQTAF
ncbi:MAG: hypothetical protein K0Q77_2225, partial [Anaerosporomusa subterranea]|nr:hypothetical protein [Anaerosporomusa subterranea]